MPDRFDLEDPFAFMACLGKGLDLCLIIVLPKIMLPNTSIPPKNVEFVQENIKMLFASKMCVPFILFFFFFFFVIEKIYSSKNELTVCIYDH